MEAELKHEFTFEVMLEVCALCGARHEGLTAWPRAEGWQTHVVQCPDTAQFVGLRVTEYDPALLVPGEMRRVDAPRETR